MPMHQSRANSTENEGVEDLVTRDSRNFCTYLLYREVEDTERERET